MFENRAVGRRTLMAGGLAALAATTLDRWSGAPARADTGQNRPTQLAQAPQPDLREAILETLTGPLRGDQVVRAVAHEHLFVDFLGPATAGYMDVNWAEVTGACVNGVKALRAQNVNLLIDWTCYGVGRNALLLKDVSRQTGMSIVCATGIYMSLFPSPAYADASIDELAAHFEHELTRGIDGTRIRAGFIKIATPNTPEGPRPSDIKVHQAAARAAVRTGATIATHCFFHGAMTAIANIMEKEGFDLRRLVWGHAAVGSTPPQHIELAKRGLWIQIDGMGAPSDPARRPRDDDTLLNNIDALLQAGVDRVMASTDATIYVNPPQRQYYRNNTYLYQYFLPKLEAKIGKEAAKKLLTDNVVAAFRRGDKVS